LVGDCGHRDCRRKCYSNGWSLLEIIFSRYLIDSGLEGDRGDCWEGDCVRGDCIRGRIL